MCDKIILYPFCERKIIYLPFCYICTNQKACQQSNILMVVSTLSFVKIMLLILWGLMFLIFGIFEVVGFIGPVAN